MLALYIETPHFGPRRSPWPVKVPGSLGCYEEINGTSPLAIPSITFDTFRTALNARWQTHAVDRPFKESNA